MNKALKSLPTLYRKDPLINTLYDAGYLLYGVEEKLNTANYNNIFFSKLDAYGCNNYEYDLDISPVTNIEDRRNIIESKWKAHEKCSLTSLQNLASRYFNNDVTVSYNGDAEVTYTARIGFKNRYREDTYNAWENDNSRVFPAHMLLTWVYDKNKWGDYYSSVDWNMAKHVYRWNTTNMTWGTAKTSTIFGKDWTYMNTRTWDETLNEVIEY